jgi:hypothetical protein
MRLWRAACLAAVSWARFIVPHQHCDSLILWDRTGKYCLERLTRQIEAGTKTLLVAVTKRDGVFYGFQAAISGVYLRLPTKQVGECIPPYYKEIDENPSLWFVLNGSLTTSKLGDFCLLSNGRTLLDVVKETRTASMLIVEKLKRAKRRRESCRRLMDARDQYFWSTPMDQTSLRFRPAGGGPGHTATYCLR